MKVIESVEVSSEESIFGDFKGFCGHPTHRTQGKDWLYPCKRSGFHPVLTLLHPNPSSWSYWHHDIEILAVDDRCISNHADSV